MTAIGNIDTEWFTPEENTEEGVMAQVILANHAHVPELLRWEDKLLHAHFLLHITGEHEGPRHEQCMDYLEKMEVWKARAVAGCWN